MKQKIGESTWEKSIKIPVPFDALWVGGCEPGPGGCPDRPFFAQQMQQRLYEQKVRQHDLRAALSDSKWVEI